MAKNMFIILAVCGTVTILFYLIVYIYFIGSHPQSSHLKIDSFTNQINWIVKLNNRSYDGNSTTQPHIRNTTAFNQNLLQCQPNNLGFMRVPMSVNETLSLHESREKPNPGGFWSPSDCQAVQKIAILFPYRNRSENRLLATNYMHNFLQKQKVSYRIFVIEQNDKQLFNRAKLLNIGFKESVRLGGPYDCYFLHDMDKLPEYSSHLYHCQKASARHMISYMRVFDKPADQTSSYKSGILYSNFFGGVTAFPPELFSKVNGMSNKFFGWGREDDNLMTRMMIRRVPHSYSRSQNAKYVNLKHPSDVISNKIGWPYRHVVQKEIDNDGLSHLNYTVIKIELNELYTGILADL